MFAKLVAETPACGRQAQLTIHKTDGTHYSYHFYFIK
jgi:hypothetical protein